MPGAIDWPRVLLLVENKRRDGMLAEAPGEVVDVVSTEGEEFPNRTDMEDSLNFRYRR